MKQGMISVIVPVYNGEKYIRETIERILNSTYTNLEVVVVDDGSSDTSVEICTKIAKNDSRVKAYQKQNGGVQSARNYGIEQAMGEYICFCDQDDIVETETYVKMVEKLDLYNSQFCLCSTGRYIEGNVSEFETFEDGIYENEEVLTELLYPLLFNGYNVPIKMSNARRYPSIWKCLIRKSFWDKYNFKFRKYVNYEDDLLMMIDMLTKADSVCTVSDIGYCWRVNLKSETYAHKFVEDMIEKQKMCFADMEQNVMGRITDDEVLKVFRQVTHCKFYLDAVHNLTSPYKKKSYKYIREYYKKTIYDFDFVDSIIVYKRVKKGHVKPKILLNLLKHKMTLVSYCTEKLLDWILLITLHSQFLTKLERNMKK